jgi:hypothetical protein
LNIVLDCFKYDQNLKAIFIVNIILICNSVIAWKIFQSPIGYVNEPITHHKFGLTSQSLHQYDIFGCFRKAKNEIWKSWGSLCQVELGDWYAGIYIKMEGKKSFTEKKSDSLILK